MAVGFPAWVLILWALARTGMIPGAAFVLASILATIVTAGADRMMQAGPRTRRILPLIGVALVVAWLVGAFILDPFTP